MWGRYIFVTVLIASSRYGSGNPLSDDLNDRVIQGEDVRSTGLFPYHAALVEFYEFKNKQGEIYSNISAPFCGATVVNENWVLTAAHCVEEIEEMYRVKTGTVKLYEYSESAQMRKISKVVLHPKYINSAILVNDIALVKMSEPLVFDQHTNYAKLPPKGFEVNNLMAMITGFGDTGNDTMNMMGILQSGVVQVKDNQACSLEFPYLKVTYSHICAGSLSSNSTSTCKGDSGGPLVLNFTEKNPTLIGVTSFVKSEICSNYPAAYTDVENYVDWIHETIDSSSQ